MEESTAGSIEKFIQHSQELKPLLSRESDGGGSGEGWEDSVAPGQDLQDYRPNPNVAIPLPPPPPPLLPTQDTGKTPNALLENRPPTPKDVEAVDAERGVCGLLNMGNTCYMNAGLQCIRNLPDIAKYYLNSKIQVPHVVSGSETDKLAACRGHLSARFGTLVQKIWSGRFSALHPQAFKTTLGLLHPQFSGSRQQDCQEFLAMLLDTLHEDATAGSHPICLPNGDCGRKEGEGEEGEEEREEKEGEEEEREEKEGEEKEEREEKEWEEEEGEEGMEMGETCSEEGKPSNDAKVTSNEVKKSMTKNSSIITDTFQGMLRNEVVCNVCGHLSTKLEPFVYLSVSLPHAYERQIEINWVPVCTVQGTRKVTRVLVTVVKHVTVREVKSALVELVGVVVPLESIILAEVKEGSIVRVLADTFPLKNVDSTDCILYAFEMAPLGGGESTSMEVAPHNQQQLDIGRTIVDTTTPSNAGYKLLENGGAVSSAACSVDPANSTVVLGVTEMLRDPWMPSGRDNAPSQNTDSSDNRVLDVFGSEQFMLDRVNTHGGKHGKESDSENETLPAKMMKGDNENGGSSQVEEVAQTAPEAMDCSSASSVSHYPTAGSSEDALEDLNNPACPHPSPNPQAVVMEWHSCSICLEEMVDSDLLTHRECGAIVCPSCLQASAEHYNQGQSLVPCPICSTLVKPSEAFLPLATPETNQNIVKLLQTNVLFRTKCDDGSHNVFGHPAILNLPSSEQSTFYHSAISLLLPPATTSHEWSLCFTDSKGRHCSRCLYSSGCRGCVMANYDSIPLELKPGDHISVTFNPLPTMTAEAASRVERHASLAQKRDNKLTLQECLENFSQRELLGSDNPWYCPQCGEMREAVRTLSVCSLPNTLIIHLKRFIYHGSTGSKVDAKVSFPLELDPQSVCKETTDTQSLELTACVCHFGTLNTGHYTAYSKHPATQEWSYYNDETVTKLVPSQKDAENAYVLFYQHRDLSSLSLSEIDPTFDDAAELKCVEQLLRVFKPPSSSSSSHPPPPLPPKKSSSETDLTITGAETSTPAQTSTILSALGLDPTPLGLPALTTSNPSLKRSSSNPHMAPSDDLPQKKSSLLEDYNNYDFMLEGDGLASGVQLLSAKVTEW